MRKLIVFNHMSLDGYFTGRNGDLSWAHGDTQDAEWNAFVAENAGGEGPLLFGRITCEMTASDWPTPLAKQNAAAVAERMNTLPKVVFSRTLNSTAWSNTTLVKGDLATEVRKLKAETGPPMAILGSGTIVSQLVPHRLIDEYQIVVNPIVLGGGRTMFGGLEETVPLQRTKERAFGNGYVLLCYEPRA